MAKVAMLDLANRIKSVLGNPYAVLWLPELTDELARVGWDALGRDINLTINNYGTARVLSVNTCAPQNIIAHLPTFPGAEGVKSSICVEALPTDLTRQYCEAGVSFYIPDEITDTKVLSCLEDAINILNRVPTLMPTVATLVRVVHLIKPEDDDYDVSFSEPHIPFSIFISVPKKRVAIDALRVAEAILHEAMHLQLTLIELIVPLVNSTNGRYFSPWRREYRTAQGVIHALYVFQVIAQFLGRVLLTYKCPAEWGAYIQKRRGEISRQICEIEHFQDCSELTATGTRFVHKLVLM
jgi:HEXXH motif-containing protein